MIYIYVSRWPSSSNNFIECLFVKLDMTRFRECRPKKAEMREWQVVIETNGSKKWTQKLPYTKEFIPEETTTDKQWNERISSCIGSGVLPIWIVKSNVRENHVSLWRRAYARNVRLHFPYRQYTNLFIFRFVNKQTDTQTDGGRKKNPKHIHNLLQSKRLSYRP